METRLHILFPCLRCAARLPPTIDQYVARCRANAPRQQLLFQFERVVTQRFRNPGCWTHRRERRKVLELKNPRWSRSMSAREKLLVHILRPCNLGNTALGTFSFQNRYTPEIAGRDEGLPRSAAS